MQATPGRISAVEALAAWQRSFPAAQLWRIPGGWYAIALPAQPALQMAMLLIAIVPILIVYPFLQRHFTKGVITGAVKG